MKSLEEAWRWYQSNALGMKRLKNLAKYWDHLPWEDSNDEWIMKLGRDRVLSELDSVDMTEDARIVSDQLDDLAILVLFSVFEANIRDFVTQQLRLELGKLTNQMLIKVAREFLDTIDSGSISNLLESLELDELGKAAREQVSQIRRWRNWVAHGRRNDPPKESVDPKLAFDRLSQFLKLLRGDPPSN